MGDSRLYVDRLNFRLIIQFIVTLTQKKFNMNLEAQ